MQKEVQGVNVIVNLLLKVQTIPPNLAICCLLEDLPPEPLPSPGALQLRAECANKKKGCPLPQ